jgi:hypothetical protein
MQGNYIETSLSMRKIGYYKSAECDGEDGQCSSTSVVRKDGGETTPIAACIPPLSFSASPGNVNSRAGSTSLITTQVMMTVITREIGASTQRI